VDFAGVERYIDTPVKRYSSGMYVRLAFGVAAHLEPEILIVDEVLAVGDAEFQKKALGKMKDVSGKEGRTVLFVSHNMQSIGALTAHCLLMNNGLIENNGKTSDIIQQYYKTNFHGNIEYSNNEISDSIPTITSVVLMTSHPNNVQEINHKLRVIIKINVPRPIKNAAISFQIFNSQNDPVIHILNLNSELNFCNQSGVYELESVIPKLRLYPDDYYLVVHFADNFSKKKFQTLERVCPFEVKVFDEVRDYYWNKNNAIYVEENFWKINHLNFYEKN
jgi:lipopolysaccharide transport system ATP-binding protein